MTLFSHRKTTNGLHERLNAMKQNEKEKTSIAISVELYKAIEKTAKQKKVSFNEAVNFLLKKVLTPPIRNV